MLQIKNLPETRSICVVFASNVPLVLGVCSPLCGPDHSLHHLNNPMHTLFPPYPNRFALDIYQSLTTPFIRSTTTTPQLPHINSWASEICPPPSTGTLTRLWRDNVSDVGGIPAFDTTPLDISSTFLRSPLVPGHAACGLSNDELPPIRL